MMWPDRRELLLWAWLAFLVLCLIASSWNYVSCKARGGVPLRFQCLAVESLR